MAYSLPNSKAKSKTYMGSNTESNSSANIGPNT